MRREAELSSFTICGLRLDGLSTIDGRFSYYLQYSRNSVGRVFCRHSVFVFTAFIMSESFAPAQSLGRWLDVSTGKEAMVAASRGRSFLLSTQNPDGSWSDDPAISGICILAIVTNAVNDDSGNESVTDRAGAYIRQRALASGAIGLESKPERHVFSTAVATIALLSIQNKPSLKVIRRAIGFLLHCRRASDSPGGGGFAWPPDTIPNIFDCHWTLAALRACQGTGIEAIPITQQQHRVFGSALRFVERCRFQGVDGRVKTSTSGGFADFPIDHLSRNDGESSQRRSPGPTGASTCAGVKCLLYLTATGMHPGIRGGSDWLESHFSANSNPGACAAGIYRYYYHFASMQVLLENGGQTAEFARPRSWRKALAGELLSRQRSRGEWTNALPAYGENDTNLCTAYAVLTLALTIK